MTRNPESSTLNSSNPDRLRVVRRTIVSAYVITEDDFLLMGRQDPNRGGTWPRAWRIPGGGRETRDLTLRDAVIRELDEEVVGLRAEAYPLIYVPVTAAGESRKRLSDGEEVWQEMDFYHFALHLPGKAADFSFAPAGDLVELAWLDRQERSQIEQIPIGKLAMYRAGLIERPADLPIQP